MSPRVKRVVGDGMVAHLWAHKAQDYARNAQHNFYFDGDTIYSYGRHFPIARHVENRRGEQAVLLTTRTYSVTTSKHVRLVRSACHNMTVFNVDAPRNEGPVSRREDFEEYRKRQLDLMRSYAKARTSKPYILTTLRELTEEANTFAKFFGLRTRLKPPANIEDMAAECDRLAKAERDRKRREERKVQIERKKRLDDWVAGLSVYGYFVNEPVRLRVRGENLETSRGASVPRTDAIRVYKILKRLRKKAATYRRNGKSISLGPFVLDSMDETGTVRVGCHEVAWEEIERVAKLAGVE